MENKFETLLDQRISIEAVITGLIIGKLDKLKYAKIWNELKEIKIGDLKRIYIEHDVVFIVTTEKIHTISYFDL